MNYIYFPELYNLTINMDQIKYIYISNSCLKQVWIDGKDNSLNIPDGKLEAVQYRLDIFFLNK